MAKKYLDYDGLLYVWQKLKTMLAPTNHASSGTTYGKGTSSNYGHVKLSDSTNSSTAAASGGTAATPKAVSDALAAAKTYADGYANQNAFGNVKVGSTTIAADSTTDTLELVAGSNITLTPDATNDTITISASGGGTSPDPATTNPAMDGTAAVGTSAKYAREDHVHPSDTSRVPTSRMINSKALTSDITLSASDVSAIPTSAKGAASGVCPLNASSKVDSSYLPSYVDDVIEAYARSGQTALSSTWLSATSGGSALTPETGKIYILMADSGDYAANTQFRWGGSAYVKLADGGVSSITNSEIDTILAS